MKILFQLSGSIACYKACHLISRLIQDGHEIQVACTESALQFVGKATLEGLSGKPVFTDPFEEGRMMDHIRLAQWADLAILCPATASAINRLASGASSDSIGSLFLAYDLRKPYLIAPAMNQQMFLHPATQESLRKLEGWGVRILETGNGRQACGDVGPGRLMEPELILGEIREAIGKLSTVRESVPERGLKILITGGGTREPIDGVRFITNLSTGSTASRIADFFTRSGDEVTLLLAEGAIRPELPCETRSFGGFQDLDRALQDALRTRPYDAIIHLAAVSDYSVESVQTDGERSSLHGKIPSGKDLLIKLKPNPKIIHRLLSYIPSASAPGLPALIGFKLTRTADPSERERAVRALASGSPIDWIVHNDLLDRAQEGNSVKSRFTLHDASVPSSVSGAILGHFTETEELAAALRQLIHSKKQQPSKERK